ncbi:RRP45 [Candida oxycetoniae]|uniref:RRP45 n=1 Tax=Candida oxycetoniae TaxID=497107 RepID=A0AAI9SZV8_9ASCO|nr:RRP45 [Candida oxycetoniae]KAI3406228.1 RRP45 [Candida oxycetoniae]
MSRSVELTTNEKNFLHQALENNLRLNGRGFNDFRNLDIYLSPTEYGYVEVSLGKTKISVRVSADIVKPYEDRPFEGIFIINSEISPMASLKFDTTRAQQQDEILISRIIEKSIRRSNAIDLENLCIVAGEKCWEITADLNFWNYDGNMIDLGCFATMLALSHFKKPDVSINQDQGIIIHDIDERQPVGLSILHIPICLTFSFFNLSTKEMNIKGETNGQGQGGLQGGGENETGSFEICILDADATEENLRDGSITITLNKNREILQLSKNGGVPIDADRLIELCFISMEKIDHLTELIKQKIKQHEEWRYNRDNFKLLESSAAR